MKEYPLTKGELFALGGESFASALALSISTWCLGQAFDLYKSMQMDPNMAASALGFARGLSIGFMVGGLVAGAIGVALLIAYGLTIKSIMDETDHG